MAVLLELGAFISIKSVAKPMDRKAGRKWERIRAVKWALTLLLFVNLVLHYLYQGAWANPMEHLFQG